MERGFEIRELRREEFEPLFRKHVADAFAGDHSYGLGHVLSDAEKAQMSVLEARMGDPFRLDLGAFDGVGNFIGWCSGVQDSKSTFYMINSAVLDGHRRQGVYSALVEACMTRVAKEGFQIVYSRHVATNNAVLIPKLKAGFVISKMELSDTYGVLVHLHYYTNETRRRIVKYRAGEHAPDAQMREIFDKSDG